MLFNAQSLFYLTCFPRWGGQTIVNDPVFTVYGNLGGYLGISGMQIGLIAVAIIGAVVGIFFTIQVKKKRH